MPSLSQISANFFVNLINRLGVRPPPPEAFLLSNVVQPVSLVDADIAIPTSSTTPKMDTPSTGGQVAAPANNTILADTGALAAGVYNVTIIMASDDIAPSSAFVALERRDAANAANIWSQLFVTGSTLNPVLTLRVNISLNERIRARKQVNSSAATTYQVSIWIES